MAIFKTIKDFETNYKEMAARFPEAVRKTVDAVILSKMVPHARANHPRRMSKKQMEQIKFMSIAKRKAGGKLKKGGRNRRFQSWKGGGGLVGSITGYAKTVKGNRVEGYLQAKKMYAAYVEFGTRTASPHPFLRPAAKEGLGVIRLQLRLGAWRAAREGLGQGILG